MKGETVGVRCGACGARLEEDFRFCPACGTTVGGAGGLACPACGLPQPGDVPFCSRCGAHLGSLGRAERRVITVLFADLSGFTRITEQLDPEAVHALAVSCLEPVAECAVRWGGHVDKFIGDSVMALFGVPEGHEDEPERAVRAALDMQRTLEAWTPDDRYSLELDAEDRPRLSVGINTGPVVTGLLSAGSACDYTALGDVVNVASRLESAGEPGEILIGAKTWRETRDIFAFDEGEALDVPGREVPVRARRVLGERSHPRGGPAVGEQARPLVDRREELTSLREAWSAAREGEPGSLLVVGEAGIGKTRLVEELIAAVGLDPDDVARATARAHDRGRPWETAAALLEELHELSPDAPGREAAAELAVGHPRRWGEDEVTALATVLGGREGMIGGGREPGATGDGAAAALTKALSGPGAPARLLVLENLHWADDATLGWLAGGSAGELVGSRLLLAVTRPPLPGEEALNEVLEGPLPRLELAALDDDHGRALLEAFLGDHRLPDPFVRRVLARAEGNPFYLEEVVEDLSERGVIERREGTWRMTGEPDRPGVPDGVESLLSTRMDALPASAKRLLQCAAVVGRRFWADLLAEGLVERPVEKDLEQLREAGMIRPAAEPQIPGEREYEFDHVLLREVAYDTLLRSVRAELHGSVAAWLEEKPSTEIPDYHRLTTYHRERSDEPGRVEGSGREVDGA